MRTAFGSSEEKGRVTDVLLCFDTSRCRRGANVFARPLSPLHPFVVLVPLRLELDFALSFLEVAELSFGAFVLP